MYKNPLNNGDISDYNSLKKQMDNGSKVKKYQSKKLETKPTELQKYYQYQTYQQPILDELNYIAERMRTEDIKRKTEEYDFIEELKIKREGLMKETSNKEGEDIAKETLFDYSSTIKNDDITPIINTDVELEYDITDYNNNNNNREQVFIYEDLSFDANNNINELSYNEPLLLEDKKTKKESKKQLLLLEEENNNSIADTIIQEKKSGKKSAKKAEKKEEKDIEKFSNIPTNKRKGKKGKKGKLGNKGGRTLDLTK